MALVGLYCQTHGVDVGHHDVGLCLGLEMEDNVQSVLEADIEGENYIPRVHISKLLHLTGSVSQQEAQQAAISQSPYLTSQDIPLYK